MTDSRPDRVYGILVREGRVFMRESERGPGLPGGVFRPLADDRKVELKAHIHDQLGVQATAVWAQGAFDYRDAEEEREAFCGFYSVWAWDGEIAPSAGRWLDARGVASEPGLPPSLRILLTTVLDTVAMKTR
jgi:hypothetical protein